MLTQGIPVGGLNLVGQIVGTNTLRFYPDQNGLAVAVALASTHTAGAPVLDETGRYLGFINEFDAMRACDASRNIESLTATSIMRKDRIVVTPSTTLVDAAKMMEEHHVVNLPVEVDGVVAYSVSRHDLLRAWIGLGVGMGVDA